MDRSLPFGLRSAPLIFTGLADAIAWSLQENGIRFQLHYLDDFLFFIPPNSLKGSDVLSTATLSELAVPVATNKTEGPSTTVTFLGIIIDTTAFSR